MIRNFYLIGLKNDNKFLNINGKFSKFGNKTWIFFNFTEAKNQMFSIYECSGLLKENEHIEVMKYDCSFERTVKKLS